MDKEMVEVILQGDMPMVAGKMSKSGDVENVEYVPLHKTVQRLHDAGYRKVPTVDDIDLQMRITSKRDLGEERPCRMAQAIHDLMMGGK